MKTPFIKLLQKIWANFFTFFFAAFGMGFAAWYYRGGYDLIPMYPLEFEGPPPEAREGMNPQVCVTYDPVNFLWGQQSVNCPPNYAYYANQNESGANKEGPGEFVNIHGACCPLPSNDILTENHTYGEFERCPDQYVATGGSPRCIKGCTMRCTQINTDKFMLGPERLSYFVQAEAHYRYYGRGWTGRTLLAYVPIAIRYAIGRDAHNNWNQVGCVGIPFGSLLTRKTGKRCDGFSYRQLQYKDGTPVKMYPDCKDISSKYDPFPTCIKE